MMISVIQCQWGKCRFAAYTRGCRGTIFAGIPGVVIRPVFRHWYQSLGVFLVSGLTPNHYGRITYNSRLPKLISHVKQDSPYETIYQIHGQLAMQNDGEGGVEKNGAALCGD
jgi:hypothetical protein